MGSLFNECCLMSVVENQLSCHCELVFISDNIRFPPILYMFSGWNYMHSSQKLILHPILGCPNAPTPQISRCPPLHYSRAPPLFEENAPQEADMPQKVKYCSTLMQEWTFFRNNIRKIIIAGVIKFKFSFPLSYVKRNRLT